MNAPRDKSLERWKLLRDRYQQRGLVLALGAGLSAGCRLPDWRELMRRMGEECLGAKGRELVDQLAQVTTLAAVAGVLESKKPENLDFLELLSRALYREFPFRSAIISDEQR